MAESTDSSSEEFEPTDKGEEKMAPNTPPDKGEEKMDFFKTSMPAVSRKKVGRPVGSTHNTYDNEEMYAAFKCLMSVCPAKSSGKSFLCQLQAKLHKVTGNERSLKGLQTFVKGKLRDMVPTYYHKMFGSGKEPTPLQRQFLSEYMKATEWQPPKAPKPEVKNVTEKKPQREPPFEPPASSTPRCQRQSTAGHGSTKPAYPVLSGLVIRTAKEGEGSTGGEQDIAQLEAGPSSTGIGGAAQPSDALVETLKGVVAGQLDEFKKDTMKMCNRLVRKSLREHSWIGGKRIKIEKDEERMIQVIDLVDDSDEEINDQPQKEMQDHVDDSDQETNDQPEKDMQVEGRPLDHDGFEILQEQFCVDLAEDEPESHVLKKISDPCTSKDITTVQELTTNTTDAQQVVLTDDLQARDRSLAFLESPLRAKMTTITLLEVYNVSGEREGKPESPFHVLEETDGQWTICHSSSLDKGNWSNNATVDHHESTLKDELNSVEHGDISSLCPEDGPMLSPIAVSNVSQKKRSFHTASLMSKGRVIRTLFKRNDKDHSK